MADTNGGKHIKSVDHLCFVDKRNNCTFERHHVQRAATSGELCWHRKCVNLNNRDANDGSGCTYVGLLGSWCFCD
jgi:hypothetical protein